MYTCFKERETISGESEASYLRILQKFEQRGGFMKKLSLYCLAGLLLPALYLNPIFMKTAAPVKTAPAAETAAPATETALPVTESSDVPLTFVELEETERWILDEVLSDYVSEDVVELQESGITYTIGDWVDRDTHTYLFFNKNLPGGTVYTAAGYAKNLNGGYVYFELSSPERLTEQQVDLEITKAFGNTGTSEIQAC